MKPGARPKVEAQPEFSWSLEMVMDPSQELYRLAGLIDWTELEAEFAQLYCPDSGSQACPSGS